MATTNPDRVSIVNAAHPDPAGSGYLPPSEEHPYWRSPEGERVTVAQVWDGADDETKDWIFEITHTFACESYRAAYYRARAEGKLFKRAPGVSTLRAELQGQLGPNHWHTK